MENNTPKKNIILCSTTPELAEKLESLVKTAGISVITVPSKDYRHSLKSVLGIGKTKVAPPDYTDGDFPEPVMIMYGLSHTELDFVLETMRNNLIPISLKAVVTKVNITWNFLQFYNALKRERGMMRGR
jgi:hypothetical protein